MNAASPRQRGFTLTEMLVVLGIILVLVSILLPAVMAAKRQSRKTVCEARLRAIGQALQIFITEHNDTIPPGCSSNSLDSPQSRVGWKNYGAWSPAMMEGFLPIPPSTANPDGVGPPGIPQPMAPIAYYLQKGAPPNEKVWSCPAIRDGKPGFFRDYRYVQTPWPSGVVPSSTDQSNGPLAGMWVGTDEFKPGYQFMSGVEFWPALESSNGRTYHYSQFATRNIAGLKLDDIKPLGGQSTANVVSFADYSVMAHSKETDDMWQSDLWKRMGNYSANFLYLDGHVEYHEFTSVAEYFKVLHKPIPQTWGAGKIQSALNAPDVWKPQ